MISVFTLLILISGFQSKIVLANSECNAREYGKGNIVCVCNENHCDSFNAPRVKPVSVTVVESNKDGKRFHVTEAHFENLEVSENSVEIRINRSKKYQKIIGFGGAFTDAATMNIKSLSKPLAHRLIADYYGKDGIQYNIGRIPIAGSDFSTRQYTYNDDAIDDFNLTHFKLADEDFSYKIPVIKEAMRVSSEPINFFGSAWTSPAWMKTNGKLVGPGFLKGIPGGQYYKLWAHYYVKFLNAYKSHGIQLWGITAGNEPIAASLPMVRWNALGFMPHSQREFIKQDLGPVLEKAGYTPDKFNVIILDDQLPFLESFADSIFGDKNATKYATGGGFHWYLNDANSSVYLENVHSKFPDKFLLATEACTGFVPDSIHVIPGDWSRGEAYAADILRDLNHWTGGWVDWNLALDVNGGPNWANNFVDAPIIVNKTGEEYYKNPMFYAMGHISKFIPRSSVRIDFSEKNQGQTITTVFETPKNETVLVVLNPTENKINYSVSDPKRGVINLSLNPNSIKTLVWLQ